MALRKAGVTRTVTGFHFRKGGTIRTVVRAWIRRGGVLKAFYNAFSVALSTYAALGRGNSASVITVSSEIVTAIPTGAIGDVTYLWARTDGGAQPWTIDDSAAPATFFSTDCDQGEEFTATFKCTITDSVGQTIDSSDVTVDCANIYYGGGFIGSGGTPGLPYP
jgi:hypothetical protein